MKKDSPINANDIVTTGAYTINNSTQNVPFGWGTLVHIEQNYALQMYFGGTGTSYVGHVRSRLGDGVWRPWHAINLTEQV